MMNLLGGQNDKKVGENVCIDKLMLPLPSFVSNSSFESHFCIAEPSHDSLAVWHDASLHVSELTEYKCLTNTRRRYEYLLRNYCAKKVILSHLKKPCHYAKHLAIDKNTTHQFILTSSRFCYSQLQVNLTHSETLGFAIVFEGLYPLGIDIEKINLQKMRTIIHTITSHEKDLIERSPLVPEFTFLTLLTAKESLCKALGGGLDVFSEVTEILAIVSHDTFIEVLFKHFPGYKGYSFFLENYVLTIAFPLPKNLQLENNIHKIWKDLNINKRPIPKK